MLWAGTRMNDEWPELTSSDTVRSAAGLLHARYYRYDQPFRLAGGAELPGLTICYETWGELSASRDNAVLVCHALSGDSHVARHDPADQPGWWDLMVGPGRPVDTDRYFVVCSNVLGGCRGSTGPSFRDPVTGRRYGADFPAITVEDMVAAQALLVGHLGIQRLLAVVGGSLGGFQSLAWAARHPGRVAGCVALATSPRLSSQAIAFDVVGRNAITHDPNYAHGQYYDSTPPASGLAIARMLAHITYLSSESMGEKFDLSRFKPRQVATAFENKFSVGSYLAYQGHKFVERFDANSYVVLSMAMDSFDLGDTRERLRATFRDSDGRFLLTSFSSDWLYPPSQSRAITEALLADGKRVSYVNVTSHCGHDAFLLPNDFDVYGELVRGFLTNLRGGPRSEHARAAPFSPATHLFHGHRLDYQRVLELVAPRASVLDLGCGDGELLALLRERGHERLMGVELDEHAIVACVARGHDVVQADLDAGLASFGDRSFDVAILSQTLQAIEDVSAMLDELVRVAARAIVSFPNFAHRPLREMFFRQGRIPKTEGPYGYEWYDSPNRRFPSIVDFEELCAKKKITIAKKRYIDTHRGVEVHEDPNLEADMAIVMITR
jgi:homoserine O-acetyltransferase